MAEIPQIASILDSGVEEADLQSALQALLHHQCLYEEWPAPSAYRLLAEHRPGVRTLLAAFGYALEHQPLLRMLALRPGLTSYGLVQNRMRKDETVALLCLRLHYEEQLRSGASDEAGRVATTTSEIYDQIRRTTEEAPPPATRLFEILAGFQRRGLLRLGERDDEKSAEMTIFPGVTVLVPDAYVRALVEWLEARPGGGDADMLRHVVGAPARAEPAAANDRDEEAHDALA